MGSLAKIKKLKNCDIYKVTGGFQIIILDGNNCPIWAMYNASVDDLEDMIGNYRKYPDGIIQICFDGRQKIFNSRNAALDWVRENSPKPENKKSEDKYSMVSEKNEWYTQRYSNIIGQDVMYLATSWY